MTDSDSPGMGEVTLSFAPCSQCQGGEGQVLFHCHLSGEDKVNQVSGSWSGYPIAFTGLSFVCFRKNKYKVCLLYILEDTARYAGLLIAPAEGFG